MLFIIRDGRLVEAAELYRAVSRVLFEKSNAGAEGSGTL